MYQYSFNLVGLVVRQEGGEVIPIVNVPDQAQVFTVTRRAPTRHDVMGARGEMNVVTTVNYSGALSFPLMQTAPENAALTALQNFGEDDGVKVGGSKALHAELVDLSTPGTIGTLRGGYIPNPPAIVRGNTLSFNVWTIMFEVVTLVHGGAIPTEGARLTNYGVGISSDSFDALVGN